MIQQTPFPIVGLVTSAEHRRSPFPSILGLIFPFVLLAANAVRASNEVPGSTQKKPIVLVGGTVHTVSGDIIADGMVLFEKGKITAVANTLALPDDVERIDVRGKNVYPSLIDAYTHLGLTEIGSVRATQDFREGGTMNPNVESWLAVNPDSELLPVTRANGVLLALTVPSGGTIAGRSSLIQLDGWSIEDLVVQKNVGMHVRWPSERSTASSDSGDSATASTRDNPPNSLSLYFEQARTYRKARMANAEAHPIDLRMEAMIPVLEGKLPLIVAADEWQQIESAIGFAVEQKVQLIIYGGYDAVEAAPTLNEHRIPVIVSGTYRLPLRPSDPYDASYTLPERLRKAGVTYCIASVGRFAGTGVRNLPYHAANAAAFGLPIDEALKSITLYPAQILGVADRVGSLEVGKDATLFVCTGDPLDVAVSIDLAFVQGRRIELSDRHKRLWQKYQQKYRGESVAP